MYIGSYTSGCAGYPDPWRRGIKRELHEWLCRVSRPNGGGKRELHKWLCRVSRPEGGGGNEYTKVWTINVIIHWTVLFYYPCVQIQQHIPCYNQTNTRVKCLFIGLFYYFLYVIIHMQHQPSTIQVSRSLLFCWHSGRMLGHFFTNAWAIAPEINMQR